MTEKYRNPLYYSDGQKHTNPDPFILRWCGKYYCYATGKEGVHVSESSDLVFWEDKGYAIQDQRYHDYWAPSVLYENGKFYMYYSNVPEGTEDAHQEHLKLAVSSNPFGPFVYEKTFFDEFSIDSHPVEWNGDWYMLYSVNNWIGTEDRIAGTCILRDRMLSPYELEGKPEAVVLPSLEQEIFEKNRFGDGRDWYTIEGACTLQHGDRCWLMYSANAYEKEDYFVGTAISSCKKNFSDMKFEKYPNAYEWLPLLKKNEEVEGTGHNTVTKAPDLMENWIVYHGRNAEDELIPGTEQRVMRMDPLWFDGKRLICDGPSSTEKEGPHGAKISLRNQKIEKEQEIAGGNFFRMELWLHAARQHAGVRYSIFPAYQDEKNYTEFQICSGQRCIRVYQKRDGLRRLYGVYPLKKAFDYSCPHLLTIERQREMFRLRLNTEQVIEIHTCENTDGDKIKIKSYFSELYLDSLELSEAAILEGKNLEHLPSFYHVDDVELDEKGIYGPDGLLCLRKTEEKADFLDEFTLERCGNEAEFVIANENGELYRAKTKQDRTTLYLMRRNGKSGIWHGGNFTDIVDSEFKNLHITLKNVRIVAFFNTKN